MKRTLFLCVLILTITMMFAQDRVQTVIQDHNEAWAGNTKLPVGLVSEFAQRFTTTANVNLLQAARLYLGYPVVGGTYTSVTTSVYSVTTAAYPLPNVLLGSITTPASAITNIAVTGTYNTIDLSSLNISFRSGEEFYIGYRVNGGSYSTTPPSYSCTGGMGILVGIPTVAPNRAARYRRATLTDPYTWQTQATWNMGISAVVDYEVTHDVGLTAVNFYGTYTLPTNSDMVYDCDIKSMINITEHNVPVRLQITNAVTNAVMFTDIQTVASVDTHAVNVVFNPYSYPTEGRYNATITTQLATDQIASNNSYVFEQQAIANYPATITYDDGSCEGAYVLQNSIGSGFVSLFTPPYVPFKITDVRYYLYPSSWPPVGGNEFRIVVYDDNGPGGVPGTELYNQVVNGIRGQLNIFDLSESNIVLPDGSFFVGYIFTQIGDLSPGLGTDNNPPFADQNVTFEWITNPAPGTLYLTGITGEDFMISSTVAYPEPQNVTIVGRNISWSPIAGAGSYIVKSGFTPQTINTVEITTTNTSWTDPAPVVPKKFYDVTATSEAARGGVLSRTTQLHAAPLITPNSMSLQYYPEIAN